MSFDNCLRFPAIMKISTFCPNIQCCSIIYRQNPRWRHSSIKLCINKKPIKLWKRCLPPAQSLDLNVIENVWLKLKIRLQQRVEVLNTADKLSAAIKDIWENLSVDYIKSSLCLGHVWKFTIEVSIANIPLLYRIRRPSGEVNTTCPHRGQMSFCNCSR
jgi:hypothetical protein